MKRLKQILAQLWNDDDGSLIATEYLALGGIVALGSVSGLVAMRDATNAEMEEQAQSVRVLGNHRPASLTRSSRMPTRNASGRIDPYRTTVTDRYDHSDRRIEAEFTAP